MKKRIKKPDHISQADWDDVDSPELTDEMLARMRPAREVLPAAFLKAWEEGRVGRPKSAKPKKQIALRLDADVVDHLRTIEGYNAQVEALLKQAVAEGRL